MRKYKYFTIDVLWVAVAPAAALFLRDNFDPAPEKFPLLLPYVLISLGVAAIVFPIAGLHQRIWRYTGLVDVLRLMLAVTVAILLGLFVSFALNRLEGVARSLPVIQWLLLVGAMVGTRIGARLWWERLRQQQHTAKLTKKPAERVLIVGLNQLTLLYLRSIEELASKNVEVVGILARGREQGHILRRYKILGAPECLLNVLTELEIHGVVVDRIVATQPVDQFSQHVREALVKMERSNERRVVWLFEALGFDTAIDIGENLHSEDAEITGHLTFRKYGHAKRVFDILGVVFLALAFAPIILLIALLVAANLGFPVLFWQQRPGRHGRTFKLYKFRTMHGPHDQFGHRIPDIERHSTIGNLLRSTRLDELPQLFNILVGEMSFVGPRPLLQHDQPIGQKSRLTIRPGLTGLAQVSGHRDMPIEDKNLLDNWYIKNASFWLDLKILFRTLMVVTIGEKVNPSVLSKAREDSDPLMINGTEGSLAD